KSLARSELEAAISRALDAPVSIGTLAVSLRADLTLGDVHLGAEGSGLSIARLDVDPDFRRLLRGEIVLNRLAIAGLGATIEHGKEGRPVVRGLSLPAPAAERGSRPFDVREVVIRDSDLIAVAPRDLRPEPLTIHVDRLLARQVPTAGEPGAIAYAGTLAATLDGVPLTAEATGELGGGEPAIEAEAELGSTPVDAIRLPLPAGFRVRRGTFAGRARYVLDPKARRDEVRADVRVSDVTIETDLGAELRARLLTATDAAVDLARGWTWKAGQLEVGDGSVILRAGG